MRNNESRQDAMERVSLTAQIDEMRVRETLDTLIQRKDLEYTYSQGFAHDPGEEITLRFKNRGDGNVALRALVEALWVIDFYA